MNLAAPLFEIDVPAYRTAIAGLSNAKFEQLTDAARHMYRQWLQVFDTFKLEYYLFAGSLVGYVRNGRLPAWMDDLDIVIFEDQIELFEARVLPYLRQCGLICWPVAEPFSGGGYHIMALQQDTRTRESSLDFSSQVKVTVPWTQIDVFYTTVDVRGFLRNKGAWGLYHKKNVPQDYVQPGVFVNIDQMNVRVFSRYEDDIILEYGDVRKNIIVYSHMKTYLNLPDTPWNQFDEDFNDLVSHMEIAAPPSLRGAPIAEKRLNPDKSLTTLPAENFDNICQRIFYSGAGSVTLVGPNKVLWAMDFKRLFPSLLIRVDISNERDMCNVVQLRHFIDDVVFSGPSLQTDYNEFMEASLNVPV